MHPHDLDAHALSEHHRRLQVLARSILGDTDRANDLVQDTWLASLRAPAPHGPRAPWLAGILRHRALKQHRADSRRAEHELHAARPLASTDEVDSALAHGRALVDTLDRLEEPYRTAIVLRYLRELSPPTIAARLGIPLETVRTRLRRGLALLRERLDRNHAGWAVALLPAALPSAPASTVAVTATLPLLLGGWMATKLAAAVVGLALIAVLIWSRRTADEAPAQELAAAPEAARDLPLPAAPAASAPLTDIPSARTPAAPEPTAATLVEPLEPPILQIHLEGWRPDDPGDVRVRFDVEDTALAPPRPGTIEPPLAEVALRPADSLVRLSLPTLLGEREHWPTTLELTSEHPDYLPARAWVALVGDANVVEAVLHLERAALVVRGIARGPGGTAPPHGRAALFQLGTARVESGGALVDTVTPDAEPEEQVELDTDGAFRLRSRGSDAHVLVVYDRPRHFSMRPDAERAQTLAPLTRHLPANTTRDLDLGTLELDTGLAIRGLVPSWRGYGGAVTAKLPETLVAQPSFGELSWVHGAFARVSLDARVDRYGHFEFTGLAPFEYDLRAGSRNNVDPFEYDLSAGSGSNADKGALGTLSVIDDSVAPLRVRAPADGIELGSDSLRCELGVYSAGTPLLGASVSLTSGFRGASRSFPHSHRISLEFPANEPVELVVEHPEHEPLTLELTRAEIPADGVLRADLEPAAARAAFTLVGTGLHAAELTSGEFAVHLTKLEQADKSMSAPRSFSIFGGSRADSVEFAPGPKPPSLRILRAAGEVRVEGVPAGIYHVAAGPRSPGGRTQAPLVHGFELELAPGEDRRVEWPVELGAIVRVTISGNPSLPIESVRLVGTSGTIEGLYWHQMSALGDSWSSGPNPFPTGRSIAQGALAPGAYRLELCGADSVVHVHPFELTLEGSPEVLVDVSGL